MAREGIAALRKKAFIDRFEPYSATEHEIVRKTGLDISIIREVLASLETYYIAPWPENLRADILGYCEVVEMTDDQKTGLTWVIENTLSARERAFVYGYYRDNKTQSALGEEYGITKSRVYQIICKAIRKLRHPSRLNYITVGYEGALARKARSVRELAGILVQEENDFKERLQGTLQEQLLALTDVPIKNLGLSARAEHALERAHIKTADELVRLAAEDRLSEIRNIGAKTIEEILNRISVLTD